MTTIGFLHPGAMGISLAASAQNGGHEAYWVSEGRSQATRDRAEKYHLIDSGTLANLTHTCEVVISICPPHAAEDVAKSIAALSFHGIYLDANAIAPQRALRIQKIVEDAGARFVDGSVVGGPAWEAGKTWLHLSGKDAKAITPLFAEGPLETNIVSEEVSQASALKMCYAAYSKGTTALLSAILAAAENYEVRGELEKQWARYDADFPKQAQSRARRVTAKAWRFAGEMDEIAATFSDAGLPGEFHKAAGEIYRRITAFKEAKETPELQEVLSKLLQDE